MRMKNLLNFTENHRYCVYREFGLSTMDEVMLGHVYQPLVGAFAISLYRLLFQQVPADRIGYSPAEQQRGLFLTLGLEPSEKGRKFLVEQTSRLEAVGLLQTSRLYVPEADDYLYEYELSPPLSPPDFFRTQHLTLLLRDKIGKFAVLSLRSSLWSEETAEWTYITGNKENISVPFYELFELNTHVIDYELEQALEEVSVSRPRAPVSLEGEEESLRYTDVIRRFPRESVNRKHVERLRFDHEQFGVIKYAARKYSLTAQDVSRLLDEDGMFNAQGDLMLDQLQRQANLQSRQDAKRQEEQRIKVAKVVAFRQEPDAATDGLLDEQPVEMEFYVDVPPQFTGKCDIHQYNRRLRNETYKQLLPTFFPGTVPGNLMDIFDTVNLSYKLPDQVINVLIHYLVTLLATGNEQRINRNFVEAIASNMLLKQVDTYEKAVEYIRDQARAKGKQTARSRVQKGTSGKPVIPVIQQQQSAAETVSEQEVEEAVRMAEQLRAGRKQR